jgi:sialate O-acetylesterase
MMKKHLIWLPILAILFSVPLKGVVRLPAIFSDHMVVQDGLPVKVWGWASPGESIEIKFSGQKLGLRANNVGQWNAEFKPAEGKGPHQMVFTGRNRLTIRDILVGEVWICSGQSNMEWPMTRTQNSAQEIAGAELPGVRLFNVPRQASGKPQENCQGAWLPCNPQSAKTFSAVAYFFGRNLHIETGKPIGLILSAWGGSPIEGWTSMAALERVKDARPILDKGESHVNAFITNKKSYLARLGDWETARNKAVKAGEKAPIKPRTPSDPTRKPNYPGSLFNGMINPIIPFSIRGAIWYQGESNVFRAHQYRSLFPAHIKDWRDRWGQGDFPFLFVQIAPFRYSRYHREMCPELWEAQLMTLRNVPNTGMVVTTDIGDVRNIHPSNKQEVGRRLALWALNGTYGRKEVLSSGPIYKDYRVDKNRVLLEFDYTGGGIVSLDNEPLSSFTAAGDDHVFHPAKAEILAGGKTIAVSSRLVRKPVSVRFAWSHDALHNLGNIAGLPASPFRTDTWPGKTVNNR